MLSWNTGQVRGLVRYNDKVQDQILAGQIWIIFLQKKIVELKPSRNYLRFAFFLKKKLQKSNNHVPCLTSFILLLMIRSS